MRYEYRAAKKIGIDGVIVEEGALVATIETNFPMGNVMACIRQGWLSRTEIAEPKEKPVPKPPPPSPNETAPTTGSPVPTAKWKTTKPPKRK